MNSPHHLQLDIAFAEAKHYRLLRPLPVQEIAGVVALLKTKEASLLRPLPVQEIAPAGCRK